MFSKPHHDLFENATDILFTLDFTGKLTSLNSREQLGYSEEALQMNSRTLWLRSNANGRAISWTAGDG